MLHKYIIVALSSIFTFLYIVVTPLDCGKSAYEGLSSPPTDSGQKTALTVQQVSRFILMIIQTALGKPNVRPLASIDTRLVWILEVFLLSYDIARHWYYGVKKVKNTFARKVKVEKTLVGSGQDSQKSKFRNLNKNKDAKLMLT